MRHRFLFIIAIFFLPPGAQAQRAEVWDLGGYIGAGANAHSSNAALELPGAQSGAPYSSGAGVNYGGGLAFRHFPFLKNGGFLQDFSYGFKIGYEALVRGMQSETESVTLINGVRTPIVFTNVVDASFTTFPLEIALFYSPFKNSFLKDLSFGIAPRISFLTNAHYTKTQQITEPDNIDFVDGGNARTDFDDELPGRNATIIGGSVVAQYNAFAFKNFFLKPEISYTENFNDVSANLPWRISSIRFSVIGGYASLAPKEFLKDTVILRDTTLQLVAFNAQDTTALLKTEFRDSTAEDENYIYTTTFQNEFYTRFTPKPAPLLLGDMRVRFLKNVLETEAISLFVEDSVVRRTIVTPEDTRLEFDTLHFTEFPRVIFYPEITSEAGIDSWKIEVSQDGAVLKTFPGAGSPPPSVEWNFSAENDPIGLAREPLDYTFSVTDREGQGAEIQRGKITFELEKKVNLPGAQLPVMREEFYFFKEIDGNSALAAFKKRVVKTGRAKMTVNAENDLAAAKTLAQVLKISEKNIAAAALPERFKNMIAVYLYP